MPLTDTWLASFCVGYGIQTHTLQIYSPILVMYSAKTSKMSFFRKAKIVQKRNEQVVYFLRATSRRQSGLFVY